MNMYTYKHRAFHMTTTTMTIRVDTDIRKKLDRIAMGTKRSRSFLAAEAIAAYVEHELAVIDGIIGGLDDMRDGRLVPHEDVSAEARAIVTAAARKNSTDA